MTASERREAILEVLCERRHEKIANLAFRSLDIFVLFVACACLAARSDATCIKTSTRHDLTTEVKVGFLGSQ